MVQKTGVARKGKTEFHMQALAGIYAVVTRETEMTFARQQPTDFPSCLIAGLPFVKALTLGLIVTWLVSIVVGTVPAHASEPAAGPVALEQGSPSSATTAPGGYVVTRSKGPGAGLLEPTLQAVLLRAAPIADREAAQAIQLRGDIDARSVETLVAAIRRGQREFAITSRGGEFMAAREMADLLNRSGSTLVAVGQCHSSCAYLWLAVRNHRLGAAADLALHASYTAAGPTNHGELWLREIGREDLVQWARSMDMRRLSAKDLRL